MVSVLGLELTSGELLFSFKEHDDIVTCIHYSTFHASKVTSASKDGIILVWDINTRRVLNKFVVGSPVSYILFPEFTLNSHTGKPDMYLVLKRQFSESFEGTVSKNSPESYKFVLYDTDKSKIRRNICEIIHPSSAICLSNIAGSEIVLAASKRKLCLIIAESRVGYKTMCPANHSITCVIANAHRDIVITGHSNGEILIWHDIRNWLSKETLGKNLVAEFKSSDLIAIPPPPSTILHWHAHAVVSLDCNVDGSMLYSGGDEGVLVVWQTNTGKKAFVPHLGASIAHVTASSLFPLAVVSTNNNCLRVINTSSLLESWSLSSLCVGPFRDPAVPSDRFARCLLEIDPKTSYLACNGYPGQLQLFHIESNSVKSIHEVVQFNRVSRTEKETKLFIPSVSLFKFQAYSGKYLLATVDVRKGEEYAAEASLKFWSWSDAMSCYSLVTHVPRPHGEHRVTSIAFSPSAPYYSCATAAVDGSVKIWRLAPNGRLSADTLWTCVYSFTYRSTMAGALSFSRDGSLLAVSHANMVTLWDPINLVLRGTIVCTGPSDQVTFTGFIEPSTGGEAYLVVGSKSSLAVYDLLTMKQTWLLNGILGAFNVAASEHNIVRNPTLDEADADKLSKHGWISVCRKNSSLSIAQSSEDADDEVKDVNDEAVEGENAAWELLVLSPLASAINGLKEADARTDAPSDSKPSPCIVTKSNLASQGTGTVFWKGKQDDFLPGATCQRGGCVLVATLSGELIMSTASMEAQGVDSNKKHVRQFPKDGTTLGWAEDVAKRNESKAAALPAGLSFKSKKNNVEAQKQTASYDLLKEGWMGDFFDGASGNVPPISSIYNDFMGSLMKKSQSTNGVSAPASLKLNGTATNRKQKEGSDNNGTDVDSDDSEEISNKQKSKIASSGSEKITPVVHNQQIHSFSVDGAAAFTETLGDFFRRRSNSQVEQLENGTPGGSKKQRRTSKVSNDFNEEESEGKTPHLTKSSKKISKKRSSSIAYSDEGVSEVIAPASSKKKQKKAKAV